MDQTTSNPNWKIHIINPETEYDLLKKARETFWGKEDESYLRWMYYENPAGLCHAAVALDRDIVAGQYAIVPIDLLVDGKPLKVGLAIDAFTNAGYRRQGIYLAVARALEADMKNSDIIARMGMANETSRLATPHMGSKPFEHVYVMGRPLSPLSGNKSLSGYLAASVPFGPIHKVSKKLKGIKINMGDMPDPVQMDFFWKKHCHSKPVMIVKDSRWLHWRYNCNPRYAYKFMSAMDNMGNLSGYLVWNEKIEIWKNNFYLINLMDIEASDYWTGTALLQTFLEEVAPHVNAVKAVATAGTSAWYQLISTGFLPFKKFYITRKYYLHDSKAALDVLEKNKWSFSFSFSDVI